MGFNPKRIETICRLIAEARGIDPDRLWRPDRSESQMWKTFRDEAEQIDDLIENGPVQDQGDFVG